MKKIQSLLLCMLMSVSMLSATPIFAADAEASESIGDGAVAAHKEQEATLLADDQEGEVSNGYQLSKSNGKIKSRAVTYSSSQACGDNLTWSLKDGVLTISGTGAMYDYGSDTAPWYSQRTAVTKIVINSGATRIGKRAFNNFSNLTSVSIPNTVKTIGEAAFYECYSITEIVLPASVNVLEAAAFANCRKLKTISGGSGLAQLGDYAFQDTVLDSFSVPGNLTKISRLAFFDCPLSYFSVATGNTVFSVKDGVLFTDQGKTLFMYPAGKSNTTYVIPSTVTEIAASSFNYNKWLTSITIPSSVKSIGSAAFQNCYRIEAVKIPDSVTSVGDFTFYGCKSLKSVTFGKGLESTSYQMFRKCPALTDINFGTALKTLYAQTFAECTALTSVTLPINITSIGNGCFAECYSLISFTSKGLEIIPFQAFLACGNLKNVTLNEGVTKINRCAFCYCLSIEAITLPYSTKFVHSLAFEDTTEITCKDSNMSPYGYNGYRYLQKVNINVTQDYNNAFAVLQLVNQQRKANGLHELVMDSSLLNSAMVRAGENALLFSHTRPDGSIAFSLNDKMIAENIAAGQATPQQVMNSWMKSQGHKENILSKNAKTIGIGVVKHNGVYYWVQCFGSGTNTANCAEPANKSTSQTIALATDTFKEAIIGHGLSWSFGDDAEYTFKLRTKLDKTSVSKDTAVKAKVYVTNPGFSSLAAVLNNNYISWSSSNTKVASVSSNGNVSAFAPGSANITAKLQHYRPAARLTVTCNHKYISTLTKATVSKNGKITYKCSCGATKSAATIYYPKKITLSTTNYTYNGKVRKPSVKAVGSNGKTISSANYTVSYPKGRKNVGKYTVTIKFKGNYSGTVKKTFNILPKSTSLSKITSKSKGFKVYWKKQASQTTGYQLQYSTSSKFSTKTTKTLTIGKNKTTNKTVSKLKSKKKYYVRVRTYKTVKYNGKSTKLYGSWSKAKAITTKR